VEATMIEHVSGLDIDKNVDFFGPISDYICRYGGISLMIKGVVFELDGQHVSIREATERISAVTDLTVFVDVNKSYIGLRLNQTDSFCLISFQ
jgi:hypothetical protein